MPDEKLARALGSRIRRDMIKVLSNELLPHPKGGVSIGRCSTEKGYIHNLKSQRDTKNHRVIQEH